MDFKVREMLSAQQKNTLSTMTEQTDIMMARSISLSEDITKELNQCLTANGKTFSDLNDNPQLIMDLEAALYPSLKSALDVKYCGLPAGLAKSDEENWENLPESDLHVGSECLVTKKLDGTSTTVTCYPDGNYEVSSRSLTFNVERMNAYGKENIYTKFTKDAVKAGLWYAKKFNTIIAIRGETCCGSVQKSSYNKDCKLEGFFVYGCEFPQKENFFEKHGVYGTDFHWKTILNLIEDEYGISLKSVPIVEEEIVSKELLRKYNEMPWEWGEGVVINVKVDDINHVPESMVWDYKSKSREYLMKMN